MTEEARPKRVSRTQKIVDVAIKLSPEFGVSEALRRALIAIPTTESSRKRACMIFGSLVAQAAEELEKQKVKSEHKRKKKTSKRKR